MCDKPYLIFVIFCLYESKVDQQIYIWGILLLFSGFYRINLKWPSYVRYNLQDFRYGSVIFSFKSILRILPSFTLYVYLKSYPFGAFLISVPVKAACVLLILLYPDKCVFHIWARGSTGQGKRKYYYIQQMGQLKGNEYLAKIKS